MSDYERFHDGLLAWEAEDGTIVYSASGLGACEAELVHSRRGIQGTAPPDWLQKAFDDGKREEKKILDAFAKEYGVGLSNKPTQWQQTLEVFPGKNIIINCHIDEKTLPGDIVEVKLLAASTIKDFLKEGNQLYEHYMYQITPYSKAWGERDVMFVIGEKDEKGGFKRIAEVQVLTWEDDLKQYWPKIKAKILKVEKMVAEAVEPACSMPGKFPCFYNFMYPENQRKVEAKKKKQEERTKLDDETLAELIYVRQAASQQAKSANEQKMELDKQIHGLIELDYGHTDKTRRFATDKVNVTEVPLANLVDWKKLWEFVEANGAKKGDFEIPQTGTYFRMDWINKEDNGETDGDS